MESIQVRGMIICRAVFTISGAAELPLNHPWQQNFSKGLQTESKNGNPRRRIEKRKLRKFSHEPSRSVEKKEKSCPSRDAAALPFQTFFSRTSVFEIDYLGLGNKCHADILGILPRCLLLSQNGAQKKKEKKGGGIEKAALYGVLLLYEDLH